MKKRVFLSSFFAGLVGFIMFGFSTSSAQAACTWSVGMVPCSYSDGCSASGGTACAGVDSSGCGYCTVDPATGDCGSSHTICAGSGSGTGTNPGVGGATTGAGTGTNPGVGGTTTGSGSVSSGVTFPSGTGLADPAGGIKQILTTFLMWLLGIFGILALISFVISGSMYLLAAGSDDMVKRAKATMEFSIIGVIVGLSGFILIRAIDAALNASANL